MVGSTMNTSANDKQIVGVDAEEFIVERIVTHRFRNGRKEYLLAWKGYPEEENTWPEQNLDCPDLIEEYENRMLQKSRFIQEPSTSLKRKPSLDQAPVPNKRGRPPNDSLAHRSYSKQQTSIRTEESSAFDRSLEAEKILGATDTTGELMLLVQWKGTAEADLVPARICNLKCPQVVIRFYEERLTWITTQQQGNDGHNSNTDKTVSSHQINTNLIENNNNNQTTL
ncbi:unnamed protein product [Rotaria socialis]